ncbi:MAG TPA: hypothetical protein VGU46_10265 [Acidobacteriaceae bacterium]|nr:hypothetical protein [Acidobacteriaceae bacterium]
MKIAAIALTTALTFAPLALLAQATPSEPAPTTHHATINQRKENQQDRISQGVKSGQLTAGETSHLEHQEAGINKEEAGMRAEDNGKLTAQDRKTLQTQQNQESRRIHRDKHNAHVQK